MKRRRRRTSPKGGWKEAESDRTTYDATATTTTTSVPSRGREEEETVIARRAEMPLEASSSRMRSGWTWIVYTRRRRRVFPFGEREEAEPINPLADYADDERPPLGVVRRRSPRDRQDADDDIAVT